MKNINNNVLLISPYLDILGGGEQHILSILKVFDDHGYRSDIVWKDQDIMKKVARTHSISFAHARVIPKIPDTSSYTYCIYVTDGSYFFSRARQTYVFFMYPKKSILPLGLLNKVKTKNTHFFANGEYTAKKISQYIKKNVEVVHPYIDDMFFSPRKSRKKIILSVGRFFPHLHSKRQDVLIQAFIKLQATNEEFKNYKLILVGGLKETKEDKQYYQKLLRLIGDSKNIEIHVNISQKELIKLYHSASIYWHSAGYGIDESVNPDAVEHLGITPLQAMAASCVTICHDSGGPHLYIEQGRNGYLYSSVDELVVLTSNLSSDSIESVAEQGNAYVQKYFSKSTFENKVKEYFKLKK